MLQILKMFPGSLGDVSGNELFEENPTIKFVIKAPIFWWVDADWTKYYFNMPLDNMEFCFDALDEDNPSVLDVKFVLNSAKLEPRQLMQILPLSTYVSAVIELHYREIIEICEEYIIGNFEYEPPFSFPNTREWKDFCETLLDIRGVRDLVKEK